MWVHDDSRQVLLSNYGYKSDLYLMNVICRYINIYMKANEFDQISIKQTIMDLKAKGYDILGRGASAIVLGKDNSDVIKIGSLRDGWLTYAKACEGQSNPYLPKIHSLEMRDGYYTADIERLHPVAESFFKTKLFKQLAAYMIVCGGWTNARYVYFSKNTPEQIKGFARSLVADNTELVAALKLIIKHKGDHAYDIHPENLMKRSDGSLVISDPLAAL
jgi:hypothetical protein